MFHFHNFYFEKTVDCSGHTSGRQLCIRATRQWGKMVMIGEGGTVEFNPSPDIIHDQKTIYGSWVTSIWKMEELVETCMSDYDENGWTGDTWLPPLTGA